MNLHDKSLPWMKANTNEQKKGDENHLLISTQRANASWKQIPVKHTHCVFQFLDNYPHLSHTVLGIKPRTSHVLGKDYTTELHPSPDPKSLMVRALLFSGWSICMRNAPENDQVPQKWPDTDAVGETSCPQGWCCAWIWFRFSSTCISGSTEVIWTISAVLWFEKL